MPEMTRDPLTLPDSKEMLDYVRLAQEWQTYVEESILAYWQKSLDWWDLFLARQEDMRDPVDEAWRSNIFVPMPFTATRTKVAQLTENIANNDPVWQIAARSENRVHYEEARPLERLVQYPHDQKFRKFLIKVLTARSVQGTSWFKVVWQNRSHRKVLYPTPSDIRFFQTAIANAQLAGAPPAPDYLKQPEQFEEWRDLVNMAGRFGKIPAAPVGGPQIVTEYEGPVFQYVPQWHVYVDPFVDEMENQKFIIHRMVKSLSYVLSRADNAPPGQGDKPYYLDNVQKAMAGWDGQVLQREEKELADNLGYNVNVEQNPYLEQAVELWEIWSPQEPYKYAIVMNQKQIINKNPMENALLTTSPNLFAVRNIMVPGHFHGLSDYQEAESLFQELNKFRRLRQDGATLTTLPVFVKQAGLALGDALRKIRPGMVLSVPGAADAVTTLIRHQLPPEAYREPPELKDEITDATEVPPFMKGEQATVGRVTGTEFSGRQSQANLKYKVDASLVEDEMQGVPPVILSFFAQMKGDVRKEIAGAEGALLDIPRNELIAGLSRRFRMAGVTKSLDSALLVQQLTTALGTFADVMTPAERRFGLTMIMELMDIRGWSKVVTPEGTQQISGVAQQQDQAGAAQTGAAGQEAEMAQEQAPAELTPEQAAAMGGGAGGGTQ